MICLSASWHRSNAWPTQSRSELFTARGDGSLAATSASSMVSAPVQADGAASGTTFRPDIQGLRAFAVTAVIAHHLLGWPTGGFVGVDVFFVISGFLITRLLVREYERDGRISWIDFYRWRARRILPAALVCLAVVVAAAFVVYRTTRAESVAVDALWSMLFVANWHFAVTGTDYFGAGLSTSPLEHFWSLAVEEQFYLIWPLLLIFVLLIVRRRTGKRGPSGVAVLVAALGAGVVISLGWAVLDTANSPAWAYFSTLSRFWELAAGSLLAVTAVRVSRLQPVLRSVLSVGGLTLITASALVIDRHTAIPGPWSLVPVVGTLLILAAGVDGQPRYCWPLSNRVAQYIGRISYSLYLWHFPIIVLLGALLATGPISTLVVVIVIIAVSVSSFNLVEQRFRRGRRTVPTVPTSPGRPSPGAAGVVLLVFAGVVVVSAVATRDPALSAGGGQPIDHGAVTADSPSGDPGSELAAELETALLADEWPELTPGIDGISETGRPPKDRECAVGLSDPDDGSADSPSTDGRTGAAADCVFGDPTAPQLAVVAGDSIAISWIPLVQQLLEPRGFRVQGLTMSGCPFVDTETNNIAANISAACPGHKAAAVASIRRLKPDIVFISNTYRPWLRDLPDSESGAARYADGQLSMIRQFADSVDRVVVLAPPPPGKDLENCATTVSSPADCVSTIPDDWQQFDAAMSQRLLAAPGTTYLDTAGWFCTDSGLCPAFVGLTATKRDADGHVVPAFARRLAPVLDQALG